MDFGPFLLLASLEGLVQAAVLSLTALGLCLVFGVMRIVNVAHGEFYMLGAVLAWWLTSLVDMHPAVGFGLAILVGPLCVGTLAFASERLILKPLNYNPEATIVATIGGDDGQIDLEQMAQVFGIPVNRVYAAVFAAGAMFAAVAAVLIVPIRQAHYLMGLDPLLLSFIVVIIGGLGSIRGTIIAAILIGMSDGIISMFFSPTLAKMVSTLLVALVLVFKPEGLFGHKER